MNSLVALGCGASFGAGAAAAAFPGLGLGGAGGFLEEPAMLLAFVLLGRALETRARARASEDLVALGRLLPAEARLVVDPGGKPGEAPRPLSDYLRGEAGLETLVPLEQVRPGDLVRVLPGETIPCDGRVVAGRGACDESLLTGEAVPVPKGWAAGEIEGESAAEGDAKGPSGPVGWGGADVLSASAADADSPDADGRLARARVVAGTVVYEGALVVRAEATGAGSRLAGVGRLVADAQQRRAPSQTVADRVAGGFCWAVLGASALTFAFWATPAALAPFGVSGSALFPGAVDAWVSGEAAKAAAHATADAMSAGIAGGALDIVDVIAPSPILLAVRLAVDVLVVACPCALGLAAPAAVLVATGTGARGGILVRGGDVLEALARVDSVVLDKTGTLTRGRLTVVGASGAEGLDLAWCLQAAAAVEGASLHPVARALRETATSSRGGDDDDADVEPLEARDVVAEPGQGVAGTVAPRGSSSGAGVRVAVGRAGWAAAQVAAASTQSAVDAWARAATDLEATTVRQASSSPSCESVSGVDVTLVHVAVGAGGRGVVPDAWPGGPAACVALRDEPRPDALWTVSELRDRLGIDVRVLSGDGEAATRAAAIAAGVVAAGAPDDPDDPRVGWGATPAGKADAVAALKARGRVVCMVGDGVNDAPALANADVGVALASGAAAAGEAAGVVLLGDDAVAGDADGRHLARLVEAIDLGRDAAATVRTNLGWALAYNAVGLPLAAGALLPSFGIALDPAAAGGMMALSSVAVVTNSLLLRARAEVRRGGEGSLMGGGERGQLGK